MRYFIELSFNGKNYHGWQSQPNAISIQEVVEQKLSILLRDAIKIVGAGRTDAGVHAKQIFAHFDYKDSLKITSKLLFKLNALLPKDISVINIFNVDDDAHARFDAVERTYEYHIVLSKNPFLQDLAYQLHLKPDMESMNKAAKLLLGHKDFQCFSKSNTDVKTYYCTIQKAHWHYDNGLLVFTISADRFLRNMVRAIVGTLLAIGFNKLKVEDILTILESKDRSNAGASAPACGLYLTKVTYPTHIINTSN